LGHSTLYKHHARSGQMTCASALMRADDMLAVALPHLSGDSCIVLIPLLYLLLSLAGVLAAYSSVMALLQMLVHGDVARRVYFASVLIYSTCSFLLLLCMCVVPKSAFAMWAGVTILQSAWGLALLFVTYDVMLKGVQRIGGEFSVREAVGRNWSILVLLVAYEIAVITIAYGSALAAAILPLGGTQTMVWRVHMWSAVGVTTGAVTIGSITANLMIDRIELVCKANPTVRATTELFVAKLMLYRRMLQCSLIAFLSLFVLGATILPFYYFFAFTYVVLVQLIIIVTFRVYGKTISKEEARANCVLRLLFFLASLPCASPSQSAFMTDDARLARLHTESMITVEFIMLDMFNSSRAVSSA